MDEFNNQETHDQETKSAPVRRKPSKPKKASTGISAPSVAEIAAFMRAMVRVDGSTKAEDVVLTAEENGVAYMVDEGGDLVSVVMSPNAYERLQNQSQKA